MSCQPINPARIHGTDSLEQAGPLKLYGSEPLVPEPEPEPEPRLQTPSSILHPNFETT